ncbi:hypothetical protein [Mycobacterium sp. MYCO198283]|uniref:hypothetical protein n=1 Tax=Mycobacterium sp. MYCO198283 TaxID=2883505 RepID=UPI0035AB99AF
MVKTDRATPSGGRLRIPRSRGATSGLLLIVLGVIGALVPFVGPYFDFAWGTEDAWRWTTARGWLEVLPGVVTVIGGLLLVMSRNRATAILGGWLAVAAGAWFVIGRDLAGLVDIGDVGRPLADSNTEYAALDLVYFSGLGALIIYLGATAVGRLSVRSVRDVRYAERLAADQAVDARDHQDGDRHLGDRQADRLDRPVGSPEPVSQPVAHQPVAPQPVAHQPVGQPPQQPIGQQPPVAQQPIGQQQPLTQQPAATQPRKPGLLSRLRGNR